MPRRALVTRMNLQPLGQGLAEHGLEAVHVPLQELVGRGRPAAGPPSGLVLVSSPATARFLPDIANWVGGRPVVAVGEATARSLTEVEVVPAAVGDRGGAAAVGLAAGLGQGPIVLLGAANLAPDTLAALAQLPAGWHHAIAYENRVPAGAAQHLAQAGRWEVAAFASASSVERYVDLGGPVACAVAVIGPATARAARAAGWPRPVVASNRSLAALAAAAAQALDQPT